MCCAQQVQGGKRWAVTAVGVVSEDSGKLWMMHRQLEKAKNTVVHQKGPR